MVFAKPHYLLFCDASVAKNAASAEYQPGGRWHFVLERIDAQERLEAADGERAAPRDRLSLLAVVRGLEALEQPSQVTLVTTSRYVARGLRYGLSEWRETGYIWEHFGVQKPIRNADLWQRIDGALQFHEVACRLLESSLAQQEVSVAEEVTKPIDLVPVALDLTENQREDACPTIPSPHFPIGLRNPVAQAKPRLRVTVGVGPEEDLSEVNTPDSVLHWESAAWDTDAAAEHHEPADADQMQSMPLRRVASVRSLPRMNSPGADSTWWQMAAGWLEWAAGRSGRARRWSSLSGGYSG